jgi:glycyl-tRNA synthetase beta chain
MPDLLFELGCEELPASSVARAADDLKTLVCSQLEQANLGCAEAAVYSTPRRLILSVSGIASVQPDEEKRQRGPKIAAAFDDSGAPTKALAGFCRGQGIEPDTVVKEGDYVWIDKVIKGRSAGEVLAEILPAAVQGIKFDKTMRWASGKLRFARPIRWMVACLDGAAVDFEVEGIRAGLESRGHRFSSEGTFAVDSLDSLLKGLRERSVEPDPEVRRSRIVEQALEVSGGLAVLEEALVDENTHLTENPRALLGDFPESFLELPEPVLITAMAKHERFFPVRGENGSLKNQFVSVWNGGEEETVRRGNQWVLGARFNDAKFFFDEDSQHDLDYFLAKTEAMSFQEQLGSVRSKSDRLAELTAAIATDAGLPDQAENAKRAGLYSKADLSSGLVSELASLQGVVGGEYAKREGFAEEVCVALSQQYQLNQSPTTDGEKLGVCLLCADQVDKLVGYLGLGLAPTGSSDPFGLRRAVSLLIEAAEIEGLAPNGWAGIFEKAKSLYSDQSVELPEESESELADIFAQRLRAHYQDRRFDLLDAALTTDLLNPKTVAGRLAVLESIADDHELIQALCRPINIVASAEEKGMGPFDQTAPLSLETPEEKELQAAAQAVEGASLEAASLSGLKSPINAFFDSTMVMVDDDAVRNTRLTLLAGLCSTLMSIGDVRKIVIEG